MNKAKKGDIIRAHNFEIFPERGWFQGKVTRAYTARDGVDYVEFMATLEGRPDCNDAGEIVGLQEIQCKQSVTTYNNGNKKWSGEIYNGLIIVEAAPPATRKKK